MEPRSHDPFVLALDTSTEVASVAVLGPHRTCSAEGLAASRSDDLIPLVDRVLAQAGVALADLAAIAVGAGPGSFTGLRIGMATAKGLCLATGLPLWSVSSLAALSLDAAAVLPVADALVVPIVDARRGEIIAGFFRVGGGQVTPLADEQILEPGRLAGTIAELEAAHHLAAFVVGGGLASLGSDALTQGRARASARATPSAESVGRLALAGPREDVLRTGTPVYIRPSAAEVTFPEGNPGSRLAGSLPGKKS